MKIRKTRSKGAVNMGKKRSLLTRALVRNPRSGRGLAESAQFSLDLAVNHSNFIPVVGVIGHFIPIRSWSESYVLTSLAFVPSHRSVGLIMNVVEKRADGVHPIHSSI